MAALDVILEVGKRRTFASAADWPGWARAGRTPELALEQLLRYRNRYAFVASMAGRSVPRVEAAHVIETLDGDATTDFGAPGKIAERDQLPISGNVRDGWVSLIEASWKVLDDVASQVGVPLAKGPRGGGRDVAGIIEHVVDAERAYAAKIGVRRVPAGPELRRVIIEALRVESAVAAGWPPAYFVRRSVWHVLDHAWEIEDRSPLTPRSALSTDV